MLGLFEQLWNLGPRKKRQMGANKMRLRAFVPFNMIIYAKRGDPLNYVSCFLGNDYAEQCLPALKGNTRKVFPVLSFLLSAFIVSFFAAVTL